MENNGKGINVFYGVIGVATLIITIVGATFAYFSATTNSDVGAVTAAGATVTLGFTDENGKGGLKTDLIPVDVTQNGFNAVVGAGTNECKDDNGNNICSVYTFTVSNPATVSQRIYGLFRPSTNGFTNLHMAIFKGNPTDIGDGFDVDGQAVTTITTDFDGGNGGSFSKTTSAEAATRKNVVANPGDLVLTKTALPLIDQTHPAQDIKVPAFEQVLDPSETATYTIVLWIDETGSAQNEDQTKTFGGGVFFTTESDGDNKTGVTGVITATS